MLGLVPDADFHEAGGVLRSGDALMMYTDGMVETRTTDIGIGIDRLIGTADRRLRSNFAGGARLLSTRWAVGPTTGPCSWSGATDPNGFEGARVGMAP